MYVFSEFENLGLPAIEALVIVLYAEPAFFLAL